MSQLIKSHQVWLLINQYEDQQKCSFSSNIRLLYGSFQAYMYSFYRTYFYTIAISLSVISPLTAIAQNSTWNSVKAGKKSIVEKTNKAQSKLKKFREHLQNFGLDTNYNHAFLLGGKLNSNGLSGCMYFVKRKTSTINNILLISFSEIKHEKQTKIEGAKAPQLENSSNYVFGKINNLYTLQIGFTKEKILLPGVLNDNLSVCIRYSGGFSLAMLKPYYLKLIYISNVNGNDSLYTEQHKYSKNDSAKFINPGSILGAAPWSKSLAEIDYVPGVFLEISTNITPTKNKSFIQSITLGVSGAYYSKRLPIMANQTAYPWQASLFAGFAIGKRWK